MESRLDEAFQPHPIGDVVEHVRSAVTINGGDLRHELERLPSDLAHYGFGFARAHRRMLAAKIRVTEVEQAEYLSIRENAEALGEKITEATIAAKVTARSTVKEARAEYVEAEYERECLRATTDALRAKRENLMSLVMLAKAEMGGMPGATSWRDPSQDLAPGGGG